MRWGQRSDADEGPLSEGQVFVILRVTCLCHDNLSWGGLWVRHVSSTVVWPGVDQMSAVQLVAPALHTNTHQRTVHYPHQPHHHVTCIAAAVAMSSILAPCVLASHSVSVIVSCCIAGHVTPLHTSNVYTVSLLWTFLRIYRTTCPVFTVSLSLLW